MGSNISDPRLITQGLSKSSADRGSTASQTGCAHPREMLEKNRRTPVLPSQAGPSSWPSPCPQTGHSSTLSQACSALQPPPPPRSVWTPGSRLIYFFCQFPRAMQNQLPPERRGTALAGPRRAASFLLFFLIEFLGWGERVRELHLGET